MEVVREGGGRGWGGGREEGWRERRGLRECQKKKKKSLEGVEDVLAACEWRNLKKKKKKKRSTSTANLSPCCSAPWGRSRPPFVPLVRAPPVPRALARGAAAEAEAAPQAGEAKEALLLLKAEEKKKTVGEKELFFLLSLSLFLYADSSVLTKRDGERLGETGRVHEHIEGLEEHGEQKRRRDRRTKGRKKRWAADALSAPFFLSLRFPFLPPETAQRRFRIRRSGRSAEIDLQELEELGERKQRRGVGALSLSLSLFLSLSKLKLESEKGGRESEKAAEKE